MSRGLWIFVGFAAGGAAGFLVGNAALKSKYEGIVQDEVASIKDAFRRESERRKKEAEEKAKKPVAADRMKAAKIVKDNGYSAEKPAAKDDKPHVVAPDDMGSIDGYDIISLTYYSDGTLADDSDRAMDAQEIEYAVGKESLDHFGEYEDDSVCVQNDTLKCYYEILYDSRAYRDVLKEKPYLSL